MKTNIYHIVYTPETKEASLFFWGCNIDCRGCYCRRRIYSAMLKDFRIDVSENDLSRPPERFLDFEEVLQILDKVDLKQVLLEGQEAGLDPAYGYITETLHRRYGCKNTLLTNGLELPSLRHTDRIEFGIKAITNELHKDYTGHSNETILQNIVDTYKTGIKMFSEIVLIPGYIGQDEVERTAAFLGQIDKNIPLVVLPYFQSGMNPWRRPSAEEMDLAADAARRHLSHVYRFTGDEELLYKVVSLFPEGIDETRTPLQLVRDHLNTELRMECCEEVLVPA